MAKALFTLNPDLPVAELARDFARDRRVQVPDVLTRDTAEELRAILAQHTPWGVAVQARADGAPQSFRAEELRDPARRAQVQEALRGTDAAAARGDYAFRSMRYSLVEAYMGKWNPGGPHDLLLEHLNDAPFMELMRQVTGIPELVKADGHASCYGPQQFLGLHADSHVMEGWRIAYVLNLTIDDWKPDWGGYLLFYDDAGDVTAGYRPRFNTLNLFAVPQAHAVSFVPSFAPEGRYAISGWLRDR